MLCTHAGLPVWGLCLVLLPRTAPRQPGSQATHMLPDGTFVLLFRKPQGRHCPHLKQDASLPENRTNENSEMGMSHPESLHGGGTLEGLGRVRKLSLRERKQKLERKCGYRVVEACGGAARRACLEDQQGPGGQGASARWGDAGYKIQSPDQRNCPTQVILGAWTCLAPEQSGEKKGSGWASALAWSQSFSFSHLGLSFPICKMQLWTPNGLAALDLEPHRDAARVHRDPPTPLALPHFRIRALDSAGRSRRSLTPLH